jgi:hypothetical protein
MGRNGSQEGIVELWGHEFSLSKNGLDRDQVVPFVDELIGERDSLIQRVEHLSSLTKLAEKTLIEADRLAEETRKEAAEQAKAEVETVLDKAKEQARQMIEEKRTEIIAVATKEAEAIKANAEHEAKRCVEHEWQSVKSGMRDNAQRLYGELLSQLENLKQQVATFETEFEQRLSQPVEEATVSDAVPSNSEQASQEIAETPAESKHPVQEPQPKEKEEKAAVTTPTNGQDRSTYVGEVELEVLPPIDVKQIIGIMRCLDSLTEVENSELIPLAKKPLIKISLSKPLPLIDTLVGLPEISEAKEIVDGDIADGKPRKIQITLAVSSETKESKKEPDSKAAHEKSVLDESKDRLTGQVYQTLSP